MNKPIDLTAEQARREWFRSQANRAQLPAPEGKVEALGLARLLEDDEQVDASLEALKVLNALPNADGIEHNLIATPSLDNGLEVEITALWPGATLRPGQTETISWELNGEKIHEEAPIPTPVGANVTFPLRFTVPSQTFQLEGIYQLRYRVVSSTGFNEVSFDETFTVDRTAPHFNNPPIPMTFDTAIVDEAYLAANQGLPATIVPWGHLRPGDKIEWFRPLGQGDFELIASQVLPPDYDWENPTNFSFTYPEAAIRALPDGVNLFSYRLTDRAQNVGPMSQYSVIEIALTPAPANMVDPVVPLAEGANALIDRADALAGVQVVLPAPGYDNIGSNDRFILRWGNATLLNFQGTMIFPFTSRALTFAELSEGGLGPKSVAVTAQVIRGSRTLMTTTTVQVNLVAPGPVDPGDGGGEVNPLLPLATVRGGGPDAEDNKVKQTDADLPATASFAIYTPRVAGERIQLFWNNVPVPEGPGGPGGPGGNTGGVYVVAGSEADDDPVPFTIPFDLIKSQGNSPAIPVFYRISNGTNTSRSPDTSVEVNTTVVSLTTPAQFPDAGGLNGDYLGCPQKVWEGARIHVPGDEENFRAGDYITISWQGREWSDPTPGAEIPNTSGVERIGPLTSTQVTNGIDYRLPYAGLLALIAPNGDHLWVGYELERSPTEKYTAPQARIEIWHKTLAACICSSATACAVVNAD